MTFWLGSHKAAPYGPKGPERCAMAGKATDKDAKPAGKPAAKADEPKVDKRKKTEGPTCRSSLFKFCRTKSQAPKEIIKEIGRAHV